ncbi:hypothetical protein [Pedobacter cryoconitis]|uniref:Uncharacterized protein n=1 Tax=Pedobacter cryoconitis TaxID=188932 RepID=A0A7X0JA15_9SPHI|nr:hypothetical protein [Pedobacter cryoconitis]MBB6503017.1 hypothetical protein [Pedobacter cryoconitis]
MNTSIRKLYPVLRLRTGQVPRRLKQHLLFIGLLMVWCFAPLWLHKIDETAGNIDQSIWLLVILSLISFMLITGLCWWLLQKFWLAAGLPSFRTMVSQFNTLSLWQQLGFYWASFALLLLVASVCLSAIC